MSSRSKPSPVPSLISPRADAIWFCLPGVIAAVAGFALGGGAAIDEARLSALLVCVAGGERPQVRTTDDYFSKRRDH